MKNMKYLISVLYIKMFLIQENPMGGFYNICKIDLKSQSDKNNSNKYFSRVSYCKYLLLFLAKVFE